MAELETLQFMGEVWDSFSGWEKGEFIFTSAFMILGILAALEEYRPNDPADIPTGDQIKTAQQKTEELEKNLESLRNRGVSGEGSLQYEKLIRDALQTMEKYRHEMFAPGTVTEIRRALEDAENFRREKHDQDAAYTLYQAWQIARPAQQQVLEGEKEWEEASISYLTVHGSLQKVFASVPEMQVQFATDCGHESLTIDADFWSEGRVKELQASMPEESLSRELTTEDIQQRTQQLRELAETLNQALTEAVDNFRCSQQRMELCESLYASFSDRGWCLEETAENGFEEGDPRRDAVLHLMSAARDTVEFTLSGAGRIEAKTTFRDVYNRNLTNYFSQILRQALQENGFTITQLTSSV